MNAIDWSKIADILAVATLATAFASLLRKNRSAAHHLWLVGWTTILLHFIACMVVNIDGPIGILATIAAISTLVAAGLCFMWATIPSETKVNCRRLAVVTFLTCLLFIVCSAVPSMPGWTLDLSAALIALGPLTIGLVYRNYGQHPLRWLTVALQFALGTELIVLRRQSGGDMGLCVDAILFVTYLGCCIYFWYSHRSGTTGSIITIGGFLAWAIVFVIAPLSQHFLPQFRIESEIWNLPKYVVAVGMLLLLLEKQIERTEYLALHDDLTALANRRLFQDRLSSAIERARRSASSVALLQVDLDGFKAVNDTHGHHIGDLLLKRIALMLNNRVRRSDTVARTGGDEFCIILEEANTREAASSVAEDIERILSEPMLLNDKSVLIGASVGVATFPQDAAEPELLCIEADMRMYSAKQGRKKLRSTGSAQRGTHAPTESSFAGMQLADHPPVTACQN